MLRPTSARRSRRTLLGRESLERRTPMAADVAVALIAPMPISCESYPGEPPAVVTIENPIGIVSPPSGGGAVTGSDGSDKVFICVLPVVDVMPGEPGASGEGGGSTVGSDGTDLIFTTTMMPLAYQRGGGQPTGALRPAAVLVGSRPGMNVALAAARQRPTIAAQSAVRQNNQEQRQQANAAAQQRQPPQGRFTARMNARFAARAGR